MVSHVNNPTYTAADRGRALIRTVTEGSGAKGGGEGGWDGEATVRGVMEKYEQGYWPLEGTTEATACFLITVDPTMYVEVNGRGSLPYVSNRIVF